jgi:hypothetical protein
MNVHDILDELKRVNATIVLHITDIQTIRARSLETLDRWNANGVWVSAHDEWRTLLTSGSDADIVRVMSSTDQTSNRLRQSGPYVGLVDQELRRELWYKYYPRND